MSSAPPAAAVSVGIDLGTSNTVVSIRRPDGRVHQQLFDGSPQFPSALYLDEADGLIVGVDAVHLGARRPERYEPNPKRRIDDDAILLGHREVRTVDALAAVLDRAAAACRQTAGPLGRVTVTVPAVWGPTRRLVIADAAEAAGLGEVEFLAEPVAAARHFAAVLGAEVPTGSGIVVYDLGGGTFDATVLRRDATGFAVLAADGAEIGGLDFDQALAEHLAATVRPEDERWQRLRSPDDESDRRHRLAFLTEVRQAKERLSRRSGTELTVPLLDLDTHLTRAELDEVVGPLVDRTARITEGVVRASGLAPGQVAGVFLVGAASRTPLIATTLHRRLGIAPTAIEQPELAVSEGALAATAPPAPEPQTPPAPRPEPAPAPRVTSLPVPLPTPPAEPSPTPPAEREAPHDDATVDLRPAPASRPGRARLPAAMWVVFGLIMLQVAAGTLVQLDDTDYGSFLTLWWAVPVLGVLALAVRRGAAVAAYAVVAAGATVYWWVLADQEPFLVGAAAVLMLAAAGLLALRRPAVRLGAMGAQALFTAAFFADFVLGLRHQVGRMDMVLDFLPSAAVLALIAVAAVLLLAIPHARRWFGPAEAR